MLIQKLKKVTKMESNFFIKTYVIKFNVFTIVIIDEWVNILFLRFNFYYSK